MLGGFGPLKLELLIFEVDLVSSVRLTSHTSKQVEGHCVETEVGPRGLGSVIASSAGGMTYRLRCLKENGQRCVRGRPLHFPSFVFLLGGFLLGSYRFLLFYVCPQWTDISLPMSDLW